MVRINGGHMDRELLNAGGRILVVDDDPQIRRVLRATLITEGHEVWDARRGEEALDTIRSEQFDLILLDINLPDMTGIEVCRAIRAGFDMAIIMLTVRSSERDKVAALDAGADDYVTKPFDSLELLARVRSQLRRHTATAGLTSDLFVSDDFIIDFAARTVTRQETKVRLSVKQYGLLRYLVSNRGKTVPHSTLLQAVWGPDYANETMLLQALIVQIRKKIEPDPSDPRYIVTIPWVGYQFQ
jgi:two-component system, OmpR family, KDP operon response regulator KdpE